MNGLKRLSRNWSNISEYVNIPFVIGFAAALTWMSAFYSTVTLDIQIDQFADLTSSGIVYLATLAIAVILEVFMVIFPSSFLVAIQKINATGFAVLMMISVALIAGSTLFGFDNAIFLICGIVIAGASSTMLLLCWTLAFGGMSIRAMFPSLILAYILSSCANIFASLSNENATAAVSFFLPLISLICLMFGKRNLENDDLQRYAIPDKNAKNKPKEVLSASTLVKLCFAFIIWAFVNRLLREEYNAVIGINSDATFAIAYGFTALIITIIIISVISAFMANTPRFRFAYIYRITFLLSLVGALILPVASNETTDILAYAFNATGYQVFCMFMWVIIASACHNYPHNAVRIFAMIGGSWSLGAMIGFFSGVVAGSSSSDISSGIVIAAVLLMALCYTVVFTEHDAEKLASIIPTRHKRPFNELCQTIGDRFGLTAREREIMMLIAKGRDSAYIQETLFLSRSTVQTHRMHLYQKLGIHNKQELLNLIDKERSSEHNAS